MNKNFKDYLCLSESIEQYGIIYIPESFSWANDIAKLLPNLQLDLPQIQKKATIDMVMDKKNPIYVQLSDGSQLFFSFDEFRKIKEQPQRGKTMILTMQRLPNDTSEVPSKITHCQVI